MLIAETCLLLAVRDRLRTYMGLDERQCDIELDDQVPTLARERYFTVTSAGTTRRPFPCYRCRFLGSAVRRQGDALSRSG